MIPKCPCHECQHGAPWLPTMAEVTRWTLRGAALMGLLAISWGLGTATSARVALGAYQREIDARTALQGCVALVDEGVRLTLDATLMARALTSPRAEPWVPLDVTVDAGLRVPYTTLTNP